MIKTGVIGYIESGDDQGKYVRIQKLPDDPPSYLVLTAADREFMTDGGDEWVEDYDSLHQFFEEARWVVKWDEEQGGNGDTEEPLT
ncbi:hypothetical protein [Streptomyces platensis]|uniref:hypothetical protein n=1 Tax=Streptomyces platensis TaxID=58346 RepID=UPI001F361A02|nr:hypothetical protein [Streptomyces platensis]MCF3145144.1 hypothetical protein [Streptomyces platensis]